MLVLTRKIGEKVEIDDGRIVVEVTAIEGSQIRLGISAPRDVTIDRAEVAEHKRTYGTHK